MRISDWSSDVAPDPAAPGEDAHPRAQILLGGMEAARRAVAQRGWEVISDPLAHLGLEGRVFRAERELHLIPSIALAFVSSMTGYACTSGYEIGRAHV